MTKRIGSHRWLLLMLAAAVIGYSFQPGSERLENRLAQALFRVLPAQEGVMDTAVVAVDSKTLSSLGAWPRPLQHLAELLETLTRFDVAAIGLALPLDDLAAAGAADPADEPRKRLLEALQSSAVVLAQPLAEPATRPGLLLAPAAPLQAALLGRQAPLPIPAWLNPLLSPPVKDYHPQAAIPLAFSATSTVGAFPVAEPDHSVWSEPLAVPADKGYASSFILALAASTRGVELQSVEIIPGRGIQAGGLRYQTDAALRIYPRPGGDRNRVPVYSVADLLKGKVSAAALRGKTVLIGATAAPISDQLLTPGNRRVVPVVWAAQGVNALIQQSLVSVPWWSTAAQRGALLLITFWLLLLPRRMHGRAGLITGLALGFLSLNAGFLLLLMNNLSLPMALPLCYLLAGHLLLAAHHRFDGTLRSLRNAADRSAIRLSDNQQSQGQTDQALETLLHCSLETPVLDALYKLGLEFERKRQFPRALQVYARIAERNPRFLDIRQRTRQLEQGTQASPLAATQIAGAGTTLISDQPGIERPVLGRYRIEHELGRGAMGAVYLGTDPHIGRTVAIKALTLTEEFETRQLEEVRRRFYQEAETAGRLNHPNIVTIYDAGEEHDLAYIAMDYIEGQSLDQHVHPDDLLPLKEVFGIGIQVAEALDYAHGNKVVHRDIKPGNIMYDREKGQLKVTDFGIACLTDSSRTRTGTVLGSPFYMSPEQIAGRRVDGRADLYSLGVTLYQLMSGRLPFEGDSIATLMYKISNAKPVPIRKMQSKLPTCVTRMINRALEKDPAKRYESGKAMAETIRRCAEKSGAGYRSL